jgi:hypothetical protein
LRALPEKCKTYTTYRAGNVFARKVLAGDGKIRAMSLQKLPPDKDFAETKPAPVGEAAPVERYATRWFSEAWGDLMAWLKLERSFSGITGLIMLLLSIVLLVVNGVTWTSVLPVGVSAAVLLVAFIILFFRSPAKLDSKKQAEIERLSTEIRTLSAQLTTNAEGHKEERTNLIASFREEIGGLKEKEGKLVSIFAKQLKAQAEPLNEKIASLESQLQALNKHSLTFEIDTSSVTGVHLRRQERTYNLPKEMNPLQFEIYIITGNLQIRFINHDVAVNSVISLKPSLIRKDKNGAEEEAIIVDVESFTSIYEGEQTVDLSRISFLGTRITPYFLLHFALVTPVESIGELNKDCFLRITMEAMRQPPYTVDLDVMTWQGATEYRAPVKPRK